VFDTPYDEIAEAVGKSPAAVRQIAHRPRDHIAARRPRMSVSTTERQEAVDRFLAAIRHGDLRGLSTSWPPTSSPSATEAAWPPAARRPIQGAQRVAGLLIRGLRSVDFEAKAVWLSGSPAARIDIGGQFTAAGGSLCPHGVRPNMTSTRTEWFAVRGGFAKTPGL
jgi:RNA polymerase sigma-70 factor (ECF subfamily)